MVGEDHMASSANGRVKMKNQCNLDVDCTELRYCNAKLSMLLAKLQSFESHTHALIGTILGTMKTVAQ